MTRHQRLDILFCSFAMLLSFPVVLGRDLAARWDHIHTPLPFDDGFPNVTTDALSVIESIAQGLLPGGSPGPTISPEGVTAFQLFQFASTVSAVFYDQLVYNVTCGVVGYAPAQLGIDEGDLLQFLTQTKAIEELHALSSIHALGHFNKTVVPPCSGYDFPVSTLDEALRFGVTYHSNMIGTAGDLATTWARGDDLALVNIMTGISGILGQQVAQFRSYLGLSQIQGSFSTYGSSAFTFTYLQSLVNTSACPSLSSIDLKTFSSLTILDPTSINENTTTIRMELDKAHWKANSNYSVVYLNGATPPIVSNVTYISENDMMVTISAVFPYKENLMDGLTLVSVTDLPPGEYAPPQNTTQAAIWAPGFILVI